MDIKEAIVKLKVELACILLAIIIIVSSCIASGIAGPTLVIVSLFYLGFNGKKRGVNLHYVLLFGIISSLIAGFAGSINDNTCIPFAAAAGVLVPLIGWYENLYKK